MSGTWHSARSAFIVVYGRARYLDMISAQTRLGRSLEGAHGQLISWINVARRGSVRAWSDDVINTIGDGITAGQSWDLTSLKSNMIYESLVVSANTINMFKTKLDKFWHNQDIIYNFRAQLQGTGSHSEFSYEQS